MDLVPAIHPSEVNRLLPNAVGKRLVERSMRRSESDQPVFPAYYDR